jgi:zinc/manganese transport system permease protein
VVSVLSVVFALVACDGGLVASLQSSTIKASVFVTTFSFAIYVLARIAGGALRRGTPRSRPPLWRRRSAA